jgi:hypothetical protein
MSRITSYERQLVGFLLATATLTLIVALTAIP